ncbi:MAG: TIGR02099 family protein [Gammaproteobacteria bacterium]|nr:TIGR02099 family protein [Gammaproteobacteria bacterium]
MKKHISTAVKAGRQHIKIAHGHVGTRLYYRHFVRYSWYLLAAFLIFLAVMFSVLRIALPYLPEYQHDIQQWVEQAVGVPVEIKKIDVRWRGLQPELVLDDVLLLSPDKTEVLIGFKHADISLAVVQSLFTGFPQVGHIYLQGGAVSVVRENDGQIYMAGFKLSKKKNKNTNSHFLTQWLLNNEAVTLKNFDILVEDRASEKNSKYAFNDVTLSLQNKGGEHLLMGSVELPKTMGKSLQLVAKFDGFMPGNNRVSGEFYVKANDFNLAAWQKNNNKKSVRLRSGVLSTELWGEFENGRLSSIQGSLALDGFLAERSDNSLQPSLAIDHASMNVMLHKEDDLYRLNIHDLNLNVSADRDKNNNDKKIQFSALLGFDKETKFLDADVWFNHFNLEQYLPLLQFALKSESKAAPWLTQTSPKAVLGRTRLRYKGPLFDVKHLAVDSEFTDVGFTGWGKVPSLQGVDGRMVLLGTDGTVALNTTDARADFRGYFRDAIAVDALQGEVAFRIHPWGITLASGEVRVKNPDIEAKGYFSSFMQKGKSPILDIYADIKRGDVASVHKYLPVAIMSDKAVDWLDRALVTGKGQHGRVLIHGRANQLKFFQEDASGHLEARFNVQDTVLDYFKNWPKIENISADVVFENRSLNVEVSAADTNNVHVDNARVEIHDLKEPVLSLAVATHEMTNRLLAFVSNSPLKKHFGTSIENLQAAGNSDFKIDITLPIQNVESGTIFNGLLSLQNNTLEKAEWHTRFEQINGDIRFTKQGANATNIKAVYQGNHPVSINVVSDKQSEDLHTNIKIKGDMTVEALSTGFDIPVLHQFKGVSPWEINVAIAAGKMQKTPRVTIQASSTLNGTHVYLPQPFRKKKNDELALKFDFGFVGSRPELVNIEYGKLFTASLLPATGKDALFPIKKGVVKFSNGLLPMPDIELPASDSIRVGGYLPRIVLDEWKDALGEGDIRQGHDLQKILGDVSLTTGELIAVGQNFGETELSLKDGKSSVQGKVKSALFDGVLTIPRTINATSPYQLDLDWLKFNPVNNDNDDPIDPLKLPPVNLSVKKLAMEKLTIDDFSIQMVPLRNGVKFKDLSLSIDKTRVNMDVLWTLGSHKVYETEIDMHLESGDIGKTLKVLGFVDKVDGGKTTVDLGLKWRGTPFEFSWDHLDGKAHLLVKNGSIKDIEPGAGRLIGLFSVDALPRRLLLDFKDFFQEGFAYDKLEGNFVFIGPDSYTQDLTIDGRSAKIEIRGRAGLKEKDYDQLVTITPNVSSTIPVLGGLASGASTGFVLLLLQKLFKKPIDKSVEIQYTITGNWDKPKITKIEPETKS